MEESAPVHSLASGALFDYNDAETNGNAQRRAGVFTGRKKPDFGGHMETVGKRRRQRSRRNSEKGVSLETRNTGMERKDVLSKEKTTQSLKSSANGNSMTNMTFEQSRKKNLRHASKVSTSRANPFREVDEAAVKKKSTLRRKKKTDKVPSIQPASKLCSLDITFQEAVSADSVKMYLQNCLGEGVVFSLKDIRNEDSGKSAFVVDFRSRNQGRKAEKMLKNIVQPVEQSMTVTIRREEPSTLNLVDECGRELGKKSEIAIEQHDNKIKEITRQLERLRISKHVSLSQFERVQSERKALKQKKQELELQLKEFKEFPEKVTQTLKFLKHQERRTLENDVKELRKAFGRELNRLDSALPIYAVRRQIIDLVQANQVTIVLGETGSGKSTQMTQYLYEDGFSKEGVIVCTQPRKVAATSLASHVAMEMGGVVGRIVGCRVGGRSQTSKSNAIVYATDHVLLNECLSDPMLVKYSCIIIDEAHERSIYSDLLLGMIKRCLPRRPDLRVVITSATIDPSLFVEYFNQCPVMKVSGRMFPVDVVWKEDANSCSDNYLQEAVNTVRQIHSTEPPGDILVFLTSPAETERACEDIVKNDPNPNLICVPLHGKLRQEEQRKVFEVLDANMRKVVFATNCAETSVTIPGIKYVVDTGMVKEVKFDPKRNKSSLEVAAISKSSAEQRKGRAGRTQAGRCYRLYSEDEFAAMEDRPTPEILRTHLSQAVLKILELGIDNISEFQFVESPPLDAINEAWKALECLGALSNRKLTELGHKMAHIHLEPRLAKLIFDGIDDGVGPEALTLASIATVNGSVFFRMGSDEEKKRADYRKVGFCHNGGDLLTLLEVYRHYIKQPKGKRNQWCLKNSLNAKSLRITEETIRELKLALKHELSIDVTGEVRSDGSSDLKLQRIVISCYAANLCVFTGHERAGYRVASFNQCVQLHPSSALSFLGATPRFIVFEKILKTSRDFALNVTPVEEACLQEMISKGVISYDVDHLLSTVLHPVLLPCSPDLLNAAFGGLRGKMVQHVEDKVAKACDDSLVVFENNSELGYVKVFVESTYAVKALSVVGQQLEKGRQKLRREQTEEQLNEECKDVRVVLGRGGVVQELLMSDMYRTVIVGGTDYTNVQGVLETMESQWEIVEHHLSQQSEKIRLFVTFKSSNDAMEACKNFKGTDVKVQPCVSASSKHAQKQVSQFRVKAKWIRRQKKGTGSIAFYSSEDFIYADCRLRHLRIGSTTAILQTDNCFEEQIFLRKLDVTASSEDVRSAVERELTGVKVKKVFIHRTPAFATDAEAIERQKKCLEEALSEFSSEGNFSVYVGKPSDKAFEAYANITFHDAEEGQLAIRNLSGRIIAHIGVVTLHPDLSSTILCPLNIYAAIESELERIILELNKIYGEQLRIEIRKKQANTERVAIRVRSDCVEHFIPATAVINRTIDGDRIDCSLSKTLEVLLGRDARGVLQSIQKNTGTVICTEWKNKTVRIHGSETNREVAKRAINKFIDEFLASDSRSWEIDLRGADRPRGLLKILFEKFGVDLDGLHEIPGVQNLHVDFRRHLLKVHSSEQARKTIESLVYDCCKRLPQASSLVTCNKENQLVCGICLCDLDETSEVYRLASCGHAYDKRCVVYQLKTGDFPHRCTERDCEELFVWRDVLNLLSQSERRKLTLRALDEYVKANPDKAKYCPTTDCGMVYRVSTNGKRYTCAACFSDVCTSCHVEYHNGLTCAMFQSEKRDEGTVEKWMAGDISKRKRCPKCKVLIEKTEGCNHMTCASCKAHMCWLCLQLFTSGEDVYDHLPSCPKKDAV